MIPGSVHPLLAGGTSYSIAYSMRFRPGSSVLSRSLAASGNLDKWTWSCWIKRGGPFATFYPLLAGTIGGSTYYQSVFGINSSDQLWYYQFTNAVGYYVNVTSTGVLRDPSAWYHIVLKYDRLGSNMVAWVNNQEYINTSSYTTTVQYINSSSATQYYGNYTYQSNPGGVYDGYMSDLHFIDNQALTPSSFAETDPVTGVWRPKKYLGTYTGTSHRLEFANSSNFGVDTSGNANNWTQSAGVASTDQMTDTPTLNYAILNVVDKGTSITTANGNLQVKNSSGGSFERIRSSIGMTTGKWYAEFVINSEGNPSRIQSGLMSGSASITISYLGNGDALSWSILESVGSLYKITNSTTTLYVSGGTLDPGDIHMLAYDADAGKFWYGKNGSWFASGNPAAGTNEMFSGVSVSGQAIFFASSAYNTSDSGTWNFGQRPFVYTPPTGFVALNSNNLLAPTIKKGNTYFDVITYTGNGSTSNVSITGTAFTPDFIWFKRRNSTTNGDHVIIDSSRFSGLTAANTFISNTGLNWAGDTANWQWGIDTANSGVRGGGSLGTNVRTGIYYDVDIDANTPFEVEYQLRGIDAANSAGIVAIYRKEDQGNIGTTGNRFALGMFSQTSTHWVGGVDPAPTIGLSFQHSSTPAAEAAEEKYANVVSLTSNVATTNVFVLTREADGNLRAYRTNSSGNRILVKTHYEKTNSAMRVAIGSDSEGKFLGLQYLKINLVGASSTATRYSSQYTNLTTFDKIEEEFVSFNSNGFTIKNNGINAAADGARITSRLNINTATMVSWAWKKSPTSGFDIVTYTGTGANTNVSHSLGVAPSMIIVKQRASNTTTNWAVWHTSIANTNYLLLNGTAAAAAGATYWNNITANSTTFSLGTHLDVNFNNARYVAYLWSEVAGFSRFGSYVGNNSTDGPFVWCGFRPRFLLLRTNALANWVLVDAVRSTTNPISLSLQADNTTVETSFAYLDILSNGFKIKSTSGGGINSASTTTFFAAFAETPFKYARAR